MADNCQVQTPKKYVIDMLDCIGYDNQLYGKRVLENSCGEGNILCEIVRRYIQDAQNHHYSRKKIVTGLRRDICAFEIDHESIRMCKKRLNHVVYRFGIKGVRWNIKNQDFLKSQREVYDFIIGNPPYITYHDLSIEQRKYLKEAYISCKEGRFDYSYAFIEESLKRLKQNGRMIYLVPYGIKTNKFARRLRGILKPFLKAVYDYRTIKIFPDVITSSVIILCENAKNINSLDYYMVYSNQMLRIEKCFIKDRWMIDKEDGHRDAEEKYFGDFFDVFNSVATLCNRAFIFSEYTMEQNYYRVGAYKIEIQLVKTAASTKSYNKRKKCNIVDKIIFPYRYNNEEIIHYQETEFEQLFPYGCEYLKQYKQYLNKRKSDSKALWFEYGRSQAVTKVFGKKLVLPMVITKSVSIYLSDEEEIPYAGYFIKQKENSSLTLKDAQRIIEDHTFYEYVKRCGTPTTPTSYRISVNDIKRFKIRKEWFHGKNII